MSNEVSRPDPKRFGMESFSELLCYRPAIIGEEPGSFDTFREGILQSLSPQTPLEAAYAENIVVIEWELIQQRRMRDAGLRRFMRDAIRDAMVAAHKEKYEQEMIPYRNAYISEHGWLHDWEPPYEFDEEAAQKDGDKLTRCLGSADPVQRAKAERKLKRLGQDPLELMATAYACSDMSVIQHDEKVQELERRRREVKRDYDALVRIRPVDGEVIEA